MYVLLLQSPTHIHIKSLEEKVKVESAITEFAAEFIKRGNPKLASELKKYASRLNRNKAAVEISRHKKTTWFEELVSNDEYSNDPALKTLTSIVNVLIEFTKDSGCSLPLFSMVDMVNKLITEETSTSVDHNAIIPSQASLAERCQAAYNIVSTEELNSSESLYKGKCADVLLAYNCTCAAISQLNGPGEDLVQPDTERVMEIKFDSKEYQAKSRRHWEIFRQLCVPDNLERKRVQEEIIMVCDMPAAKKRKR